MKVHLLHFIIIIFKPFYFILIKLVAHLKFYIFFQFFLYYLYKYLFNFQDLDLALINHHFYLLYLIIYHLFIYNINLNIYSLVSIFKIHNQNYLIYLLAFMQYLYIIILYFFIIYQFNYLY